ncbi:hypothetical protein ACFPVY_15720 [Flavobacterium qiangtangense]|uniref:Uncharacterized protein n=1 Tax=Flavobacterium qiangtangense TaxID=1442595 RepID=A0ABW1PRS3_9FLAO
MNKQVIKIESFNPYESRFPKRKLITRDTLILIKYLRTEGYDVIVTPEDATPVEILYRKGFAELFADPLNVALFGIPITVFTTIVANQIQKFIDKFGDKAKANITNVNITVDNSTNVYNCHGKSQSKKNQIQFVEKKKKLKDGFQTSFKIISPNSKYPTPIFLEHKPKIVGWCLLHVDDKGLKAEGILTDKLIKKRVAQNRLNGMSVTGIAKKTECSICSQSYTECNHIAGNFYDEIECFNTIVKTDFVEASIVKDPINKECLVNFR